MQLPRRTVLKAIVGTIFVGPFFVGCEKHYKRPGGVHNLGQVQHRLFPKQHIRDKSMLLFRDEKGWSVISTYCTYEGCDLTYQDTLLLCSCCESSFDLSGKVLNGPAVDPLPYYEIFYKENLLFADSGKVVDEKYRYTTPEIERAIETLRERIRKEGIQPSPNIPPVLWNGQGVASDVPIDRGTSDLGVGDLLSSFSGSSSPAVDGEWK